MNWLRLEGAGVDDDVAEGLEARVADPLWLLARQWQGGEFHGEDAASPVLVGVEVVTVPLTGFTPGDGRDAGPRTRAGRPLETLAEQEPVTGALRVRLAIRTGWHLVRTLQTLGATAAGTDALRSRYRVRLPADNGDDPAGVAALALLAGRSLDGLDLGRDLGQDAGLAAEVVRVAAVPAAGAGVAVAAVRRWAASMADQVHEPDGASSWQARDLEYRFGVSADVPGGSVRLAASEYRGGTLDWYHFDVAADDLPAPGTGRVPGRTAPPGGVPDVPRGGGETGGGGTGGGEPAATRPAATRPAATRPAATRPAATRPAARAAATRPAATRPAATRPAATRAAARAAATRRAAARAARHGPGPTRRVRTLLPAPLRFPGMPARRFWEIEGADVSFGDLVGGPEDLPRAVVAGFAALYADDWMSVPCTLPVGTLARVTRVSVLDDYGQGHDIPAAAVVDGPGRAWRFFELGGDKGPDAAEPGQRRPPWLLLAPALPDVDQGPVLERVDLARDEVSNLTWAIERRVVGSAGRQVDRRGERPLPAPAPALADAWRYRALPWVPLDWIPLVPVLRGGSDRCGRTRARSRLT